MQDTEQEVMNFNEDTLNHLYDSAMAIKTDHRDNPNNKTLFTSVDQPKAAVEAALHIAYILTTLKEKVLVVNLDSDRTSDVEYYLQSKAKPNLFSTLKSSMFLSEAINHSIYDKLDIIYVEDLAEAELAEKFNDTNVLSKLSPLKNYYNHILIIGPPVRSFKNYGMILDLADSAVTILSAKTNDKDEVYDYLQKINLFNVKSFGILRKSD